MDPFYPCYPYPTYPYYYQPYYGYRYYEISTGLKLDLSLIPKDQRNTIKRGRVFVDGAEVGVVGKLEGAWHSALPLEPGTHEVAVLLDDGRQAEFLVGVFAYRITKVGLRWSSFTLPPPPTP